MILDFASVTRLFVFLNEHMVNSDHDAREKCYVASKGMTNIIARRVTEAVVTKQTDEAEVVRKFLAQHKSSKLKTQKQLLLDDINAAILKIANYEATVLCVLQSFKKGLNGCQEHATLVSLALMKLYGVNRGPLVENFKIQVPNTFNNHEFVVFDRSGEVEDVSTWGKARVLDSWGKWQAGIDSLPFGTGLYDYAKNGKRSGLAISVMHDNRLGLHKLTRYKDMPNHFLHKIEKLTLQLLDREIEVFINDITESIKLPTLTFLPSVSHSNMFSEFPELANDADAKIEIEVSGDKPIEQESPFFS
ncbi:hypothetical protein [Legionella brunensis]|uniref:hypothetical protein n=1 Tax=Legionella brunensis TaxID=29422 RepID=UPI0010417CEF|nr:hypothetical protein [Legionella brunensis]